MAKIKYGQETLSIADAVSTGMGILQTLRDDVSEVVENAPEGLQDSARISTLRESSEALDDVCDDEPEAPAEGTEREITVRPQLPTRKGRSLSRAAQLSNALCYLIAAVESVDEEIDALNEVIIQKNAENAKNDDQDGVESDEAQVEALTEYRDAIQEVIDAAEGCEFPSMFG